MTEKKRVLMVCLGNTCRSTIAEAIFKNYVEKMNYLWEVDSSGLRGYHVGEGPNQRALNILEKNGIKNYHHIAKVIKNQDFDDFDWIFGMDEYNLSKLIELKPKNCRAQVELLGKYHPSGEVIIEDPYFENNITSFQTVYDQCVACVENFLKQENSS
ncbi:low molecular weight phosphotyrosine protein phosphatase 1-like [Leptopilina heterotoma]|uniref:low molecular weight phosphotyrosine protein phosphatase 1-like n=1 Tax=Leptopilina heterotoma TaxID=63436 RepID=UPI001CA7B785|nr:low molecular weight phosphotyrosine protein phosphatase 1-like [Leptopilina heterotoma]